MRAHGPLLQPQSPFMALTMSNVPTPDSFPDTDIFSFLLPWDNIRNFPLQSSKAVRFYIMYSNFSTNEIFSPSSRILNYIKIFCSAKLELVAKEQLFLGKK